MNRNKTSFLSLTYTIIKWQWKHYQLFVKKDFVILNREKKVLWIFWSSAECDLWMKSPFWRILRSFFFFSPRVEKCLGINIFLKALKIVNFFSFEVFFCLPRIRKSKNSFYFSNQHLSRHFNRIFFYLCKYLGPLN